jgi:alkylation response protein AidB-like acyl-CoA dehydrogenase
VTLNSQEINSVTVLAEHLIADFRASVREFIASVIPPDWSGSGALDPEARSAFRHVVRAALAERGWIAPNWPTSRGGRTHRGTGVGAAALEFGQ